MSTQLPLGLSLRDDATFDNFCVGHNESLLLSLRHLLQGTGEKHLFLWGETGVGKTHLLQASCHALEAVARSTVYVPLMEHAQLRPELLEDMEQMDLVCLDGIEHIAGNLRWEEALFHLYNRIIHTDARLIVSAASVPMQLAQMLPDLRSRLAHLLLLQVHSLSDEEKLSALQLRARTRGLELPYEVGQYLLRHYPRHMSILFQALEQLDRASLVMQRRLTIPFVKQVLSSVTLGVAVD